MQHPGGIAHATGIETHINDLVLHFGQPPLVSVVEQKTPCGTRGVLAQVPLRAAACFPAFDDLIAVTMRTPDRDERHGTLLASERCQEKAHCDINLGLSPHLEHYPKVSDLRQSRRLEKGGTAQSGSFVSRPQAAPLTTGPFG